MAIDNSYLVGLIGGSTSSSADLFSALVSPTAPQSPAAGRAASPSVTMSLSDAAKKAPTPPWLPSSGQPRAADLARRVLANHPFIDESSIKIDNPKASGDYRKLFAAYQGLSALDGLVALASNKTTTALQLNAYQKAFEAGISQISTYVDGLKLDGVQIASGKTAPYLSSSAGVKIDTGLYAGAQIYQGAADQPVPAFQGDVRFSMAVKKLNGASLNVDFDLSEMGSTPRTMGAVVAYLNARLADAGVVTRFGDKQIPAPPKTITIGGKSITLAERPPGWALTLNKSSAEQVTLGSPQAANAVYVVQAASDVQTSTAPTPVSGSKTLVHDNVTTVTTGASVTTTTVTQQLVKFQADASTAEAPPDATARPGDSLSVAGRAWSTNLSKSVSNARAVATGADGSVYVLTEVNDSVAGQALKGTGDVALMKYDPAGNLIFTRTFGASNTASGLGLAVSADGKVAVAGSITGALGAAGSGVDPAAADSFVSLYDASGNELWTQRRAARADDQANAVAFDPSGHIFVAGKAQSPMPGAGAAPGGRDGYLEVFDATGKALSTRQFGTSASDSAVALAADASGVTVGSIDDGHAVLRRFDLADPANPSLSATRDLGDLKGGNLAGLSISGGKLYVAGTSRNPALGGAAAVNTAPGGSDVYVAALDPTLADPSTDKFAWYGGSGADTATGMTVVNGKVYVTGSSGADLPGSTPIGKQDGFAVALDPTTGAASWSKRFSGPGGRVSPTAIAVAGGGASVLDRLGLPMGTVTTADTDLLTSATSLRAGDSFYVATGPVGRTKVTIDAGETLLSLAAKINRATGFRARATMASGGSGIEKLQIKPASASSEVILSQGPTGSDALESLGISPGVVENTPKPNDPHARPLSGLDLTNGLKLSDPDSIASARTVIEQAMSTVRVAYQSLATRGQPRSAKQAGPAPQYLRSQIANYQAALARLGG